MPNIPFPKVPNVAGVPMLKRAAAGLAAKTGLAPVFSKLRSIGLLDAFFAPQWGIFYAEGLATAITPDSIVAHEVKADYEISNHPVEKGQFASYNKVAKPREVMVQMTCTGQASIGSLLAGADDRPSFLIALDDMVQDLEMYTICTPDASYENFNLIHYDYKRTAQNGVSMITANCRFQEVRNTAFVTFTETAKADGQKAKSGGQSSAKSPKSSQKAAIDKSKAQ